MALKILIAAGGAIVLSSTLAIANVSVNATDYSKHAGHRHHYARNVAPTPPPADQYVAPKATPDPSYYTHAGSGTAYY